MEQKKITTCFVAGRSGGHIVPALTLAHQLIENNPNHKILFFTTDIKLDKDIIAASSDVHTHVSLPLDNIPFKNLFKWPGYAFKLINACITSFYVLRAHKPDKVVSMGGYISLPVCLAAKLQGIPIELFELNVEPGKTTKILARYATKISICFEETQAYLPSFKCIMTSYPIRFKLNSNQKKLRVYLGILPDKRVILVLGGSQGSLFINLTVKKWLEATNTALDNFFILHQVGSSDLVDQWQSWYNQNNIDANVFAYRHDIENMYTVSDIIICRSGAGTLFEVLFFNKKCITIPLQTSSNSHQIANAKSMEKQYPQLFFVMYQSELENNPMLLGKNI